MSTFVKKEDYLSLFIIFSLILVAMGTALYCQYPSLKNKLLNHCDINQYFFPISSLLNPKLFVNDNLAEYMLYQTPKGFIGLFFFFGRYFDLVFLAKVMPFVLFPLSVIYLFLLGKNIGNDMAGFIMSFLFIFHSWTFHAFQGTTPRAFTYPLLIPFIYYLFKNRLLYCFLFYVLQICFYPPAALISLFVLLFSKIDIKKRVFHFRYPFSVLILFTVSFPLFYFLQFGINTGNIYGPVITLNDMLKMPEFFTNGQEDFFFKGIVPFLKSRRAGLDLTGSSVFIFILSIALFLLFRKTFKKNLRLPRETTSLCLSSLIIYTFSYIFLFHLYYPARYVMFSLPLLLCVLIGILFSKLLYNIKNRLLRRGIFICFILVTVIFYFPMINGRTTDHRNFRDVIDFLSKVPEDSVIASTPYISDPIPTFALRKVLFSRRLLMPFRMGYYAEVKGRVYDFYDAYFSDSIESILNFCHKYSVDYIVFNRNHFIRGYFEKNAADNEPEPFSSYIVNLARENKYFVLPNIDKRSIVFEKNGLVIIKASKLNN